MNTQLRADLSLLLVSLLWGMSYFLMDVSLTEVSAFMLNTYRFLGAFFLAVVFSFKWLTGLTKETVIMAAIIGLALSGVYIGATTAVLYTSLSNTGFLCALAVVFTPLLGRVFKKTKLTMQMKVVVVMALIGIALLSITDEFTVASGDLLAIGASLCYAIMILTVDTAVKNPKINPYHLGVMQLGFTGFYFLVITIFLGDLAMPTSPSVLGSIVFLAIFCTGVSFIAQSVAQKYTTPVRVGVIFSTEPVFAGVAAFVFAGEILTIRAYIGAAILLSCLFVMELDFSKLKYKFKKG